MEKEAYLTNLGVLIVLLCLSHLTAFSYEQVAFSRRNRTNDSNFSLFRQLSVSKERKWELWKCAQILLCMFQWIQGEEKLIWFSWKFQLLVIFFFVIWRKKFDSYKVPELSSGQHLQPHFCLCSCFQTSVTVLHHLWAGSSLKISSKDNSVVTICSWVVVSEPLSPQPSSVLIDCIQRELYNECF